MAEEAYGAQEPVGDEQPADPTKLPQIPLSKKDLGRWKDRVSQSKKKVADHDQAWKDNVAQMAGKPLKAAPEQDTVVVNKDWSRVKAKQAQLFYQVPRVNIRARQEAYKAAAPIYAAALNFELEHRIKAQVVMDEVLADVLNAAGIGISKIGYDGVFEQTMVPKQDPGAIPPEMQAGMLMSGAIEMVPMSRPIYECYYWKRVSPNMFLFPVEFTGTNWDDAPWLGFRGYMPFTEAKRKFNLPDDFKGRTTPKPDLLSSENDTNPATGGGDDYVEYCEIWYKAYLFDEKAKHPQHFRRLVLVEGLDKPARHEDSPWQRKDPQTGKYVGLCKYPLRVLTLTTISDTSIPPSDTQVARPQVLELIRSRSQMMRQRERSQPLRWFDVNQVDDDVAEKLRSGVWQDIIPMNGPGDRAIGEIARANYPRENFEFDRIANQDLNESWSMGPNQLAAPTSGETTAAEANIMQGNANTRLDYDRAKVLRYFVDGAEGIGSLMQLFHDREDYIEVVGPDGASRIEQWDRDRIKGDYIFEAKPDSAQRVDVGAERTQKVNLYQMVRNDPNANARVILEDVLRTHNIDPVTGMQPPPQPAPEKPAVSYRFGGEDLVNNPIALAIMNKSGVTITAEDIANAKMMIQDAMGLLPPQPPAPVSGAPGAGEPQPPHGGPAEQVTPLSKHLLDGKTS
jgi:hypothetical protein